MREKEASVAESGNALALGGVAFSALAFSFC